MNVPGTERVRELVNGTESASLHAMTPTATACCLAELTRSASECRFLPPSPPPDSKHTPQESVDVSTEARPKSVHGPAV